MKSETLQKAKDNLLKEIEDIETKDKNFQKQDSFKLSTNTAYLLNMKMFSGWNDFREFIETKHEQHWSGENSSQVEVTFKIKGKKKAQEIFK